MNIETIRETVAKLNASAGALAVLAGSLDARLNGATLDAKLSPHAKEVLDALGLDGALDAAPGPELAAVLNEIRAFWHLNAKLLHAAGCKAGWTHSEPELLQTFGALTKNLPVVLKRVFAPQLDGLGHRLEQKGAAFLDVGVGVGALAIEMARAFPELRVVGVDPWAPSLALARENVAQAGLAERIELRRQGGEELTDRSAFDLAWIASPFMPEEVVPAVLERVLAGLRAGGWALFAIARPSTEPLADALWRFRVRTYGGGLSTIEAAEALLRRMGYTEVRALPSPPGAIAATVAGRRKA